MKSQPNELQKKLLEAMEKYAKEKGLEIITKTIHFDNDDVPKFLEQLKRFKEKSSKSNFRVKYCASEPIHTYSSGESTYPYH